MYMKRLTTRNANGKAVLVFPPNCEELVNIVSKLAYYEDMEEKRLLKEKCGRCKFYTGKPCEMKACHTYKRLEQLG